MKQNKLIEKLISQLLNIEIMDLHTRLVHTKKHIKKIKNSLEKTIEKNIISLFSDYYTTKLTFIISPLRIKLEKKLNNSYIKKYSESIETNRYLDTANNVKSRVNHPNLNTQYNEPYNIERNKYEKWCVNVSDVDLPTYVTDTLKLGEKFNFNDTFDKNLTLQYLKNFETFANNYIDDKKISKVRGTFLKTIKKYHNKELSTITHNDKKFKIDLQKTKIFIKNNPDILITRADKGNATVIIKQSSYLEKTESLFKDEKYYKEIKKIHYQV